MSSLDLFDHQPAAPTPGATMQQPAGKRHIEYAGQRLNDPGPAFSAQAIKEMYVSFFPELGNCKIEEKEQDGIITIRFVKRATTKG